MGALKFRASDTGEAAPGEKPGNEPTYESEACSKRQCMLSNRRKSQDLA